MRVVVASAKHVATIRDNARGPVVRVSGSKCRDCVDTHREMARALSLPSYYGHNWDAFEECMADLSWLPSRIVIMVDDAMMVLPEDDAAFAHWIECMVVAGSESRMVAEVVLVVEGDERQMIKDRLTSAHITGVEVAEQ